MPRTRRSFLKEAVGISSGALLFQSCPPIPEPRRRVPVDPPEPLEKQDSKPAPASPSVPRHLHEKELRETVDQLLARVQDLKTALDHTPGASVFSVAIFKQTQEIEKLAKRLKNYASP